MKINYWQDFEEGCFYHIYNHAVSDRNIFVVDNDYQDFLEKHKKYLSCVFEIVSYCLMPNHFHFIVQVKPTEMIGTYAKKEISSVSLAFQKGDVDLNSFVLDQYRRFFSSYSLAFNFRHGHRGPLFLKRFKRVSFDPDRKLASMVCYLHHNPIHHGFTQDYRSWDYSSYLICLEAMRDSRDGFGKIIKDYFRDSENYQKLHDDYKRDQKDELDLDLESRLGI